MSLAASSSSSSSSSSPSSLEKTPFALTHSFSCCGGFCRTFWGEALCCGISIKRLKFKEAMEVYGKSTVAVPSNVIYMSSILGQDGPNPVHKCDWKCANEHVCGNMYRCRLTGLTHICDKNCNQRILYDNHSSLCRVSKQIFPLTLDEEHAVRGVRRKIDAESSPSDCCAFKRRRDGQFHTSPFERAFSAVGPICSPIGDGMDMS
ncbi:hypothetical protein RHMOL_Rhmol09G0272600 [Rhododendron molle]|uniref:Uncharacterized protein n=1 Tax=Rhododendron molle TaxID=49168 RepID=A0ACC0MJ05_RHOML|nr:hypothetical protein RHMOL_Rhmol09G0272600 [Rhododendron molle]